MRQQAKAPVTEAKEPQRCTRDLGGAAFA